MSTPAAETADSVVQRLRAEGRADDLDLHFARLMTRMASTPSPWLALAAAGASHASAEGHVCTSLPLLLAEAARVGLDGHDDDVAALRGALERSGVVGAPGDFTPLVLDAAGRLYLWRYHDWQRRVARQLTARVTDAPDVDPALLREGLQRLFAGNAGVPGPDRQRIAAAVAVLKRLAVVSGGPGTGKTTTVARILALLTEQGLARASHQPPRIVLAAPTGKAAARLQEAIRIERAKLDVSDEVRALLPESASTLHRLLGAQPGAARFRHHAGNPLAVDALVVDEASMVDLALMAQLLDALPATARLVLLGDRDQLASVEAGAVLGELCTAAGRCSAGFAQRLHEIAGCAPAVADAGRQAPLADCVVLLEHSFRFGARSGIGRLAHAVREGDADTALEVLRDPATGDARWLASDESAPAARAAMLCEAVLEGLAPWLAALVAHDGAAGGDSVARLLADFGAFRLLCAHREGAAGVAGLNATVEAALLADGRVLPRGAWYHGRPLMVTRNDYGLRLYNGDTGITLAGDDGLRVWFESGAEGTPRGLSPGRLPAHETVWAMTVHKSQGSEFEQVLLALPERASPVLSRELVYTAITRARGRVTVLGSEAVLREALAARAARRSGLADELAAAVPPA